MGTNDESNVELEVTFGFPIVYPTMNVEKNNIPPYFLPHFHGMVTEDHDAFIFKFDILF
jgi:hypothetical protein